MDKIQFDTADPEDPVGGGSDRLLVEEDIIMLEMVMRQSLVEYNKQNNSEEDEPIEENCLNDPYYSWPKESKTSDDASYANKKAEVTRSSRSSSMSSRPKLGDREFSLRTMREIERTEIVVDNPHVDGKARRRRFTRSASLRITSSPTSKKGMVPRRSSSIVSDHTRGSRTSQMEEARKHLSSQELMEIEKALRDADATEPPPPPMIDGSQRQSGMQQNLSSTNDRAMIIPNIGPPKERGPSNSNSPSVRSLLKRPGQGGQSTASVSSLSSTNSVHGLSTSVRSTPDENFGDFLSHDEAAAIEAALREADAKEEQESLMLALQIQEQEISQVNHQQQEVMSQRHSISSRASGEQSSPRTSSFRYIDDQRNNPSSVPELQPPPTRRIEQQASPRRERARGPGAVPDSRMPARHPMEDQSYSSSRSSRRRPLPSQQLTRRTMSESDLTHSRAMEPHVRLEISRAINGGLIGVCNGAVKQGREATLYHAEKGGGSNGYDVAIKVYRKLRESRGESDAVDGDPRYSGFNFRNRSKRVQIEVWTEKEFRNLVRAHRAKVPVPTPLHYKENIIFMRFMGNDGWPAPTIRGLQMRHGSKKWDILYTQVMEAVRRLYIGARLVHGDLSEHSILVAPVFQVDHPISSLDDPADDLQIVLTDFGQAVDLRYLDAMYLLRRDLDRIRSFFGKHGVKTLPLEDAVEFVVDDFVNEATGFDDGTVFKYTDASISTSLK